MDVADLFQQAVGFHREGRLQQAVALYRQCLATKPHSTLVNDNLAQALLGLGQYEEGFARYEVRFHRADNRVLKPTTTTPEWRGEPVSSLLIFGEQGFGDQIQFARFARILSERGVRVTLVCSPELVPLLSRIGLAAVLPLTPALQVPKHDAWVMSGSLPNRMGLALQDISGAPYIPAPASGEGVGLAWRGRPTQANDANRSMPREAFEALKAVTGGLSLDPEDTGAEDFAATADIIAGLGLVVTVDTAIAHLAGAMGKPCWVMLCAHPCWRWLQGRSDSPWYASMRLYRQAAPGDWTGVIRRIAADLKERVSAAS